MWVRSSPTGRARRTAAALLPIVSIVNGIQDPEASISRALAADRTASVSAVHYDLTFRLAAGAAEVAGTAEVEFAWQPRPGGDGPLVLDFAGVELSAVTVNGEPAADPRSVNGHLLVRPELLRPGVNTFRADFRSAVAATGTPLSVYRDPADGREYYYTLVVPADAHRLYPCFDQPDLKARFRVALELPAGWQAVANGAEVAPPVEFAPGRRRWTFAETPPISTYLQAFACGPFDVVTAPPPEAPGIDPASRLRIFVRENQRRCLDQEALVRLHSEGLRWLGEHFGVAYPFGKLDLVLLPGFPYGGMEHAGAIFYREQALLFDHPPTDGELVRRSTLVYHELSHQWFGNLVTMRWFDDLWLKEGFATFIGYQALAALEPERRSWLRFLQRVKPRAYEVDATPGTTPVWQELQNLADAKSAYGAIVYNKAPAVLRELHERLGATAFRSGLQAFLEQHAFGNADWRDLARALERAARTDLGAWSDRWLLAPSLPRVRVEWEVDAHGVVRSASLHQAGVNGPGAWPLRLDLLVFEAGGGRRTVRIDTDLPSAPIPALVGQPAPVAILPNPGDVAYGQFVPDARSREWLLANVAAEPDPLLRAVATNALLEAVRETELDPARFAAVALDLIEREADPDTHAFLLDALGTCLHRWLDDARARPLRVRAGDLLLRQLRDGVVAGRALQTFRFLARHLPSAEVLDLCRHVAAAGRTDQEPLPPGLVPGKDDRFLAAAALLAAAAADGEIEALQKELGGEDVGKQVFLARAATPTAAQKRDYWRQYCTLEAPPEQWTQDSLAWFHWPGQQELTLPFLRPALERIDWVKQNRRIFFMPAWIDGFVNGHSDARALAVVREFLGEAKLADDTRRKLLQSLDGLERAVRIRERFGGR
jgi:aminopeptidase N